MSTEAHTDYQEQNLRLRVSEMRREAKGVVSVRLQAADGTKLPEWAPGAHIDLHLPGGIIRQYSLCGSPGERTSWRIAVLRDAHSRGGSAAVHELLHPGDTLRAVGPRNRFPLVEASTYLFIAGGIGITPLLPMLEYAAAHGARWRLVYGGRSLDSMAFASALQDRYGSAVEVFPQDRTGLLDLDSLLGSPQPDTKVYCCGPERLLNAVEQRCAAHWPRGALHVERFAPKPDDSVDPDAEFPFDVVLQRSGVSVTVPPGKSILECLEAEGVEPLNSCREGLCGTCETTVLEGIPDHRDSLLSDDERAMNDTMMICVSRARSARLVLDL